MHTSGPGIFRLNVKINDRFSSDLETSNGYPISRDWLKCQTYL